MTCHFHPDGVERRARAKDRLLRLCRNSLLALLLLLPCIASGAGGDIIWEHGDYQAGKQEARASVVDGNGNIIIAGYQNLADSTNDDFLTVKMAGDGSGVLWRALFDKAGGADQATAVAVDSGNNVIVTGYAWNGVNNDIRTIKYDGATGAVLWQHSFNGAANGQDISTSIAVDALDNVYVGGYTQNASGSEDYLVLKYGPAGPNPDGTPLWQATYRGTAPGANKVASIAAGGNGVAVTGQSWNGAAFDILTLKYDFGGTRLWEQRYTVGGTRPSVGKYVKMDSAGNVVITGYAANELDLDIHTAKYAGDTGTPLWQRTYNGAFDDEPSGLYLDAQGSVYITGYTWTLTGRNDFVTARYNGSTGSVAWEKVFDSGNGGDDITTPTGIIVDPAGDVFVTGYKVLDGNYDFMTIKYKKDNGNLLWSSSFNGTADANDRPVGIGLSPAGLSPLGEVLVGGWSDSGTTGLDYYAIKYDPGLLDPPTMLTAQTVSSTSIRLDWTVNSTNEDGFAIERCAGIDCTDFAQVATVGAGIATHTDSGLAQDVYYYYRVKAYNAADGSSHYSNVAQSVTTFVTFAPPAWTHLFNSPANSDDYATAIAVGGDNNPVVTGYSNAFAPGYTSGTLSFDYYTVKLNRLDTALLWSAQYDDPTNASDIANCIAVDAANAVTVSGYATLYNGHSGDVNSLFTIKYPAGGPPAMASDQYNGPVASGATDDRAVAIASATDASGNTAVVGYGKNADGNDDIYLLKYRADGTRAWAATPFAGPGGGDDIPAAVAFAQDGSIYVTGYSEKAPGSATYSLFTARYNGTSGAIIWSDIYSATATGDNRGKGLLVDPAGDIYVAASVTSAAGNRDIQTIKYRGNNATAEKLWQRAIDGAAHGDDEAAGIALDPIDAQIVVAGTSLTTAGDADLHIARYNAAGDLLLNKAYLRPGSSEEARAIALDSNGNIYLTGHTDTGGSTDSLTVKFDFQGNLVGATLFNGAAGLFDETGAIALNSLDEAFVAGYSENASGNADYLVYKVAPNTTLPSVPSPFAATAGYATATLSWIDRSLVKAGYTIERKLGACSVDNTNPWGAPVTLGPTAISYTDSGLTSGSSYCYRIRTFQSGGIVSRWNETSATTLTPTAPASPGTAVINTTQVNLAWSDTTTGEAGFRVERCGGAGCSDFAPVATTAANAVTYADTSACNGTVFSYRVFAFGDGWESPSSTVVVAAATPAPKQPTSLSATRISEAQIALSWVDTNTDETGFKVERCSGAGCSDFAEIASLSPNTSAYGDTSLLPDTSYSYRIKVVKSSSCGWEMTSATATAVTTLLGPASPTVVAASTTQANFSWTDRTATETGFEVERCQGTDCSGFVQLGIPVAGTTSYSDTTVCAGSTYSYRVRAVNGTVPWFSAFTNPVTITMPAPVDPVLTATKYSEVAITLTWTDVGSDESGYRLERCSGTGCINLALIATFGANTLTYRDQSLTPGTSYTYRVTGFKTATCGWTRPSNLATAVTGISGPTNLGARGVNTTRIDLSWTDSTASETGFGIERCSGSACSDFTQIAVAAAGSIAYSDTTVCSGQVYSYRIRAVNSAVPWQSDYSLTAVGVTPQPTNFLADASFDNAATSWSVAVGTTTGTGFDSTLAYEGAKSLNLTATGVTLGRAQSLTVVAGRQYRLSGWFNAELSSGTAQCDVVGTGIDSAGLSISVGSPENGAGWVQLSEAVTIPAGTTTVSVRCFADSGPQGSVHIDALTFEAASFALTATRASETQINLAWPDISGDETGYAIERCVGTDCTTFAQVATVGSSVVSYSNAGLSPNTLYRYQVRPYKTAGCGWNTAYTPVAEATTTVLGPTGLTATAANTTQVNLAWTDRTASETAFSIERCSGSSCADFAEIATTAANAVSWSDTAVFSGTSYRYRLRAVKTTAPTWVSDYSSEIGATTPTPAAPVLTATAISETRVNLSWTDPTTDESNYKVDRCTGSGCTDFALITTLGAGVVSYQDSGLAANTTYTYQVRGSKSGTYGWTTTSNAAPAVTVPLAPTGLGATPANTTQLNLAWNNRTTTETGVRVERCQGSGCSDFALIATTGPATASYADSAVCSQLPYTYRVQAVNATIPWSSTYSSVASATPSAPALPYGLTVQRSSEVQLNLAWTDTNSDETGFKIERCLGAGCTDFAQVAVTATNLTSHADSGLLPNSHYRYRVRTYKTASCGWDSDYTAIAENDTTVAAPGSLQATPLNSTHISLAWLDTASSETGFRIERCTGAGCADFAEVATAAANSTAWTDATVASATVYQYRIRSTNGTLGWDSPYSAVVFATTPSQGAPSNLSATATTTEALLGWADNTVDETGFKIERCLGSGCSDFAQIALAAANAVGYRDASACNGATYRYRVRATSTVVPYDTPYSGEVEVTTLTPATPSLTASEVSEGRIDLAWNDPTSDETGFAIERCAGSGCSSFVTIALLAAGSTSYADAGVVAGNSYSYRVRDYKTAACGWETLSEVAGAATSIAAPTSLTAVPFNTTQLNLAWSDTSTSKTGFRIERCTGSACTDFREIAVTATTAASYADTAVAAGTAYSYRVRTTRTTPYAWDSPYSGVVSATTPAPQAPTALAASPASTSQINLAWSDTTGDETGFAIESCSGSGCASFAEVARVAAGITTFARTGLAPATTYCFRVRSYKTATNSWLSGYSNTACSYTVMESPTALAATPINSVSIRLNWNGTGGEDGYAIEGQLWNGDWAPLASVGAGVTSFIDTTGIDPQNSYAYRLRAYRGASYSTYSNQASVTTPAYLSGDMTCAVGPSDAPVISSTPITVATEGAAYSYIVLATATGGGSLTYSLASKPSGMTISAGGLVEWTPDFGQGGAWNVTVRVTDTAGRSTDQSFVVTVGNLNRPPVITSGAVTTVTAGQLYSYQVAATDPDGDQLSYALTTAPAGMSVSPSGLVTWTPVDPAAAVPVSVSVSDGTAATPQGFAIDVGQGHAPTITSTAVTAAKSGIPYSYALTVNNPDGYPLTYSLDAAPAGMAISGSGVISWIPAASQVGGNSVTARVSDGVRQGTQTFTVTVAENHELFFVSTPVVSAWEELAYAYPAVAVDPAGGVPAYELTTAPTGMTISAMGTINWTPTSSQLGSHQVTVSASMAGSSVTQSFTVTVLPFLPSPVITPLGSYDGGCSDTYLTLTWSAVTAPNGHAVEYAVELDGVLKPWQSGTTFSFWSGAWSSHTWRVKARDAVTTTKESAWSASNTFNDTNDPYSCYASSCPLVFAFDGGSYSYVTDLQGPIIGLPPSNIKKDTNLYQPAYASLDRLVADSDGIYRVKIRESLPEIAFVDEAKLLVADYPEGYGIVTSGAENTYNYGYANPFRVYTIKDPIAPVAATDQNGVDVLPAVSAPDNNPASIDLNGLNYYTLDFGTIQRPEHAKLLIDGWSVYSVKKYTSAVTIQPYVELVDQNGNWVKVASMGTIAGDLKTMVVDLSGLFLSSDHRIRVHLGIRKGSRWVVDRFRLDDSAPVAINLQEISAVSGNLLMGGAAIQTMGTLHSRIIASDVNLPVLESGLAFGSFTRYGEVGDLLTTRDDKFVVMRHGDRIDLAFPSPGQPQPGQVRGLVFKVDMWYKTLTTSNQVEPLPFHGMSDYPPPAPEAYPTDADHEQYLIDYNTREFLP